MSNPWYDKVNGRGSVVPAPFQQQTPMAPMNPMGLMNQISQAMQNPQSYAMQAFRDVPQELWNYPANALQYIMQTRGLTQADVQNMIGSLPIRR